jgi:hypothetical protein
MNNASCGQVQFIAASSSAVFYALREKLTIEVSSSAKLAELLEKVSLMQKAQANPVEFRRTFLEFVDRAEEHLELVQPFFPALVIFLPPPQFPTTTAEAVLQEMRER